MQDPLVPDIAFIFLISSSLFLIPCPPTQILLFSKVLIPADFEQPFTIPLPTSSPPAPPVPLPPLLLL